MYKDRYVDLLPLLKNMKNIRPGQSFFIMMDHALA